MISRTVRPGGTRERCMRRGEWSPSADLRGRPGGSTKKVGSPRSILVGSGELDGGLCCGALVGRMGREAGDRLGGRHSRSVGL